ncbi:unnamed protein product [Kluyveromyces dobzhanskii CBS 2104]|uniref:Ribosomal lysine N-methyltransferase 4 n=1 Tax=Kluyveromyces dobzhanskii CBS 2104 TaxID=1427455 RepID=A0A0A8L0W9_9SACH|nr:unnamed protein product [Kluyveromyces dobzhanskii CBS 2104]
MTATPFERLTDSFVEWLPTVGIDVSTSVKIADSRDDHQGRSMICVRDVKEGEQLFSVPNDALLNVTTGSLGKLNEEFLSDLLHKVEHWEGLILTILYEWKYLGEKSKWWCYLQVLPDRFDTLVYWDEKDLATLRPSLVLDRLGVKESKLMYEKVLELMETFGVADKIGNVSYDDFQRVASWIMAYSFDKEISNDQEDEEEEQLDTVEKQEEEEEEDAEMNENKEEDVVENSIGFDGVIKCMIAVADILNSDTNLVNANIIYDSTGLICCATKDIKAGEQVYNIYGDHPNAELLRRYGYVEWSGSKYDFGEVTLMNILETLKEKYNVGTEFLNRAVSVLREDEKIKEIWDYEDVVLDSYDCYADGETIPEAASTIQILFVLLQSPDVEKLDEAGLSRLLQRVVKKCQQLLESGRVTESVDALWQSSVEKRLQMYPAIESDFSDKRIKEVFRKSQSEQRQLMASCVLECERKSIESARHGITKQFKLLDDEKLLKNVLKRPADITESVTKKKSKIVKRVKKNRKED